MRRPLERSEDDNHCYIDRHLRVIYIEGEITSALASKFRRYMRTLERSKKPITVEINSPGGDIEAGLMIVDTINLCSNLVITRVTGQAYSMACVIACSGNVREILPNSTIMAHQGSFAIEATYDNLNNEIAFVKRLEALCWSIMDVKTNKKPGYWKKKCGTKDYYMSADLSIREGLVDKICI